MWYSQGRMRLLSIILIGTSIILSQDENVDSVEVHSCDSPLIEMKNSDENRALKNIYSCLKPGAQFAISVPNKWWIFETHGAHLPLLSWNRVPFFSWLPRSIHSKYAKARIYTKGRIKQILIDNGFNIVSCEYVTAPMDVVSIRWLQSILRKTIFKNHSTSISIMATSIIVLAEKPV